MDAQPIGLWLQTAAIIASAAGVATTIFLNLKIAKRRATLDILLQEQSNDHLIKERTSFNTIRDNGHLAQWLQPDKVGTDAAAVVRSTLNRYELVGLGIRKKIVDEKVYRAWFRSTLVRDWIAFKPLVVELRNAEHRNTYYQEFEGVAKKWAEGVEKGRV